VILSELGETYQGGPQRGSRAASQKRCRVVLIDALQSGLDGSSWRRYPRAPRFQKMAIIFVSAIQAPLSTCCRGYASGAVD